jgi:hypothetical protein
MFRLFGALFRDSTVEGTCSTTAEGLSKISYTVMTITYKNSDV